MRTLFTRFALLAAFGFGALRPAAAQQTVYVPAAVTGYTADVIANGSGAVTSSTTATIDRGIPTVRWCFANSTFPGLNATNSLPANGTIVSISTPGLTFQMDPATSNNSLRIDGAGSGTLTLTNPQSCSEVMMLATEGNGTTAPEKRFVVNFTDGTSQTFTNIIVPDWFSGTITPAYFVNSRVSAATNAIDLPGGNNPRLYEVRLSLNVTNYNKAVQSVTVSKTSTDPVLNIMGVSLGSNCLSAPTAGIATANLFPAVVCPNTPVVLALAGNDNSGSITYQWQRSTDNGVTWTDIAGATTNPYTIRPTVTAQYRARVICRLLSSNSTPVTVTVSPSVATVSYSATPPAVFCKSGTAPVVTATPAGGTFSSTAGLVINATTGTINLDASTTGTYTVTYSVPNACQAVGTTSVSIINPVAALSYPETTFCRTGSSGAPTFSPAGGTFAGPAGLAINASTGVIDLAASTAGTYAITYNSGGQCPSTASASVLIKSDALPTFPTIITPNGDRKNDELKPLLTDVTNYHIRVFSRWGRKVYEGTNPNAGWTATENGPGIYYYQLEYNDCAGRKQQYKGWLDVVK